MKSAVRLVRATQFAMLASIVLLVVTGELAPHKAAQENTLFHALSFLAISVVGAAFVLRRTLVLPSEYQLARTPEDPAILARWRSGYLATYVMCDVLALFGMVLRLLGYALIHVWGFYLGAFLLLLLFSPRPPRA